MACLAIEKQRLFGCAKAGCARSTSEQLCKIYKKSTFSVIPEKAVLAQKEGFEFSEPYFTASHCVTVVLKKFNYL